MDIVLGLEAMPTEPTPSVVAVGVFDGVHRGHQEILGQTAREARSLGLSPLVLTFDIHPTALFAPERAPSYISALGQRLRLIDTHGGGIARAVVARFDHAFAALAPDDFVDEVLVGALGARHVLVGADFRYGRERAGSVTTLLDAGARRGFAVTVVPPILRGGARISSTEVRARIASGDIPGALDLLGHSFSVEGTVVAGKRLGREIGYPTANLRPTQTGQLLPGFGVYAGHALLADGRRVRAAISVGVNPTTDTDNRVKVEAYLMDGFDEDLYGQPMAIDFRVRVRAEVMFASLDALVAQIGLDVAMIDVLLTDALPTMP